MKTAKTKFKPASKECAGKQTEIGMIPEEWVNTFIFCIFRILKKERI